MKRELKWFAGVGLVFYAGTVFPHGVLAWVIAGVMFVSGCMVLDSQRRDP